MFNLFGTQTMKAELADECDYVREASFMKTFGSSEYLGHDPRFKVPWVWDGSTSTVLVMEHVDGVSVGEANAKNLTEGDRNDVRFFAIHGRFLALLRVLHFARFPRASSSYASKSSLSSARCRPIPTGPTFSGTPRLDKSSWSISERRGRIPRNLWMGGFLSSELLQLMIEMHALSGV